MSASPGSDAHKESRSGSGRRGISLDPEIEVLQYRTFYGVLQQMAADLRKRGVTHVVMEASGACTEPVYYALAGRDFDEVAVINPAHARALKGHKTDARDCLRVAELSECGLLRGSYISVAGLKEVGP
jgi:transposase